MKEKNHIWRTVNAIIYVIVIFFALLAVSAQFNLFGLKLLVVKSGSMEPTVRTGALAVVKTQDSYAVGDVVTFSDPHSLNDTITHRLVSAEYEGSALLYTTQGDANGSADALKISADKILGRLIFSVPFLGYVTAFVRTPLGLILLIVLPAVLIIYDEILNIKREVGKKRQRIRELR